MASAGPTSRVATLTWRVLSSVGVPLGILFGAGACHEPVVTEVPLDRPPARPTPILDPDEEALLASLVADDPGDYHVARARIWRIGGGRWRPDSPEFGDRPSAGPRERDLPAPVEVVVVDAGPRVLLPLAELGFEPELDALRLVAHLQASDLVAGLTRELHPTAWLTLAAGVGLTPLEREGERLRVRWGDPDCGFGLELVLDAGDFGPTYEPGPSGRPGHPAVR